MDERRRELLTRILAAVAVAAWALSPAQAQQKYPSQPITLVVPYPAGGFIDVTARHLAEGLRQTINQTVIVNNRPGANGKLALAELIRQKPDGYTLLLNTDGGIGLPPAVDAKFNFNFEKDYTPIVQIADGKYVLTVSPSLSIKSAKELVEYARANPGTLTFGSPGVGTTPHMAIEVLMRQTGIQMLHVPYQGAAPAAIDLMRGQIDILVNAMPGLMGYIGSDKMRMLAAFSDKRLEHLPNVPTITEAGLEPITAGGWIGVFGPPGMSRDLLETIDAIVRKVMENQEHAARFRKSGAEVIFRRIDQFPAFYQNEVRQWIAFAKKHKLRFGD